MPTTVFPRWRALATALLIALALALLWAHPEQALLRCSAAAHARALLLQPPPPLPLPPPPHVPPYVCSAAHAAAQLARLVVSESSCPSSHVWARLLPAGLACAPLTLLNVGANKGYTAAALLGVLRPELGVDPPALYTRLVAELPNDVEDAEGLCGEAHEQWPGAPSLAPPCPGSPGALPPPLALHLFEPLPGNAMLLRRGLLPLVAAAAAWAGNASQSLPVDLHVHELALVAGEGGEGGEASGGGGGGGGGGGVRTVQFGACAPGNERCGVGPASAAAAAAAEGSGRAVRAASLDEWLGGSEAAAAALPRGTRNDVMVVDAEGQDPELLLQGARALLARQGVRVLQFEYQGSVRGWARTSLRAVTGALDALNYDCFFLLQHGAAVRITGCWMPAMEFRQWANVLCVRRGEAGMLAALNAMTPLVSGQARSPNAAAVSVAAAAEEAAAAAAGAAPAPAPPLRVKKKKRGSAAAGAAR